jgi:U6 snRNA phosphodiesterase
MNDEATRTFLAVEALGSGGSLEAACAASDAAAASFRLPLFYSERRFHVSIAWTHGDQRTRLQAMPPPSSVEPLLVRSLTLSAGHLTYTVPLAGA